MSYPAYVVVSRWTGGHACYLTPLPPWLSRYINMHGDATILLFGCSDAVQLSSISPI